MRTMICCDAPKQVINKQSSHLTSLIAIFETNVSTFQPLVSDTFPQLSRIANKSVTTRHISPCRLTSVTFPAKPEM